MPKNVEYQGMQHVYIKPRTPVLAEMHIRSGFPCEIS